MNENTKTAMENISVIKSVLDKTWCDITDISSFFISLGVIQFLHFFLPAVLSLLTKNTSTLLFQLVYIISITAQLIVFAIYIGKIRKKDNFIASAIVYFWLVCYLILPAFIHFISGISSAHFSELINTATESGFVTTKLLSQTVNDIMITSRNYEFLVTLSGIILIGILLRKKIVLIIAGCIGGAFILSEFFLIMHPTNDGIMWYLWLIAIVFIESFSVLSLGIILKLDGRKRINGIE